MDAAGAQLDACERWFVRRGVPHFIADYDAREDIWTRSIPFLVFVYALRALNALDLARSFGFNLLALLLIAGVLVATWAITNSVRQRPAFAMPRQVGSWELAVYVIGPEVPSLLLGQFVDAIEAAVAGLVSLLVVYVVTSYGVIPMLRWAAGQIRNWASSLGSVLTRALPLLLVSVTFLFFTGEVWQSVGELGGLAYLMGLALFVIIGVGFVLTRLPGDVRAAGTLESWDEVRSLCADTPARDIVLPAEGRPPEQQLTRRQYVNVALVGLFARTLQIIAVAIAVWVFLCLLGSLTIGLQATTVFTGAEPHVLLSVTMDGRELVITEPLVRVAGFLATFAGLSFTVYLVTDATYRDEFRGDLSSEVREAFAVRAAYLHVRRQPPERFSPPP